MTFTPPFFLTGRKVDDEEMVPVAEFPTEKEAIKAASDLYADGAGWFAIVVKDNHGKNVRQFGT